MLAFLFRVEKCAAVGDKRRLDSGHGLLLQPVCTSAI